jgi:hypothetical protein
MAITVIEGAMPGTGMTMFATYMAHRRRDMGFECGYSKRRISQICKPII